MIPTFSVNMDKKQGLLKSLEFVFKGKDIDGLKSEELDLLVETALERLDKVVKFSKHEEVNTKIEKKATTKDVSKEVGLGRLKQVQAMRKKHKDMKEVELKEEMLVLEEDIVDIIYKKDYEGILTDFYKFEIKMFIWEGISVERLMQLYLLYEDKVALKKIKKSVEYMSEDESTKDAIKVILTDSVLSDMIKDNSYMVRFKSKCYSKAYDLTWDKETQAHREFRLEELSKRVRWRAEHFDEFNKNEE